VLDIVSEHHLVEDLASSLANEPVVGPVLVTVSASWADEGSERVVAENVRLVDVGLLAGGERLHMALVLGIEGGAGDRACLTVDDSRVSRLRW